MRRALAVALTALAVGAPAAAAAPIEPFGHECKDKYNIRFCTTENLAERVPSWDGHPMDVDVSLPRQGKGPWPTILMLHAFGQNKVEFESVNDNGKPLPGQKVPVRPNADGFNNVFFARRGYAVMNYSERGWGNSCGVKSSRTHPACDEGWWHFADQRFEVRDAQYLLGQLVDEGITKPGAIGVGGASWGSGQSMQLAYLRDRVRLTNGHLIPWKSPEGTPLKISAAAPRWTWADLGYALQSNGRYKTTDNPPGPTTNPVGMLGSAYADLFLIAGSKKGFIAPKGVDPTADPKEIFAVSNAGEPYGKSIEEPLNQMREFSGITRLPAKAAPLMMMSGWNDDLFPPEQTARSYHILRKGHGDSYMHLQWGDVGHPRAQNKHNTYVLFNKQVHRFFDHFLKGKGKKKLPKNRGITAMTTTCPEKAPADGPYRASTLNRLSHGTVAFGSTPGQKATSRGGSAGVDHAFTPIFGTLKACTKIPQVIAPGTANYQLAVKNTFTMLGLPTVRAKLKTKGPFGQLDASLFDVAPKGSQRLVSRAGVRLLPHQSGRFRFQLSGNGYRFKKDHIIRLEISGRDPMYRRPSNGKFSFRVKDLKIELPTKQRPDGQQIRRAQR